MHAQAQMEMGKGMAHLLARVVPFALNGRRKRLHDRRRGIIYPRPRAGDKAKHPPQKTRFGALLDQNRTIGPKG